MSLHAENHREDKASKIHVLFSASMLRHTRTSKPVNNRMKDAVAMGDFDKDIVRATLTMQVGRDHICNPWQRWELDIFALMLICA